MTIGARVPDHGKLAPWRFIVFEGDARVRGGEVIAKVFANKNPQASQAEIDLRNEKINYKVREHSLAKIPALLAVGKKEAETHSVSVRRLGSDAQKVMPTDEAIAALVDEATPPDVKRARTAAAA